MGQHIAVEQVGLQIGFVNQAEGFGNLTVTNGNSDDAAGHKQTS